ncbi:MAG: 50S ribosomal protein L20 [Candidatus Vogelbacteria bacterium]|nr:50S ribosomal protein L20 [Candidatus Vogelbacteria bacterium]
MPRVKRGTIANKTRRNLLKRAKGFRFGRSKKEREARTALLHAGVHAFTGRRDKKNDFRRLWQIQIGAAVRSHGLSYSKFIGLLKKNKIELDRKILATLAKENAATFDRVVAKIKE